MNQLSDPLPEAAPGRWSILLPDGRVECQLCPRYCRLRPGQRGFCFVRQNQANRLVLTTYGKSSGFCIDPIEKKPLNHFYPGSSVLSFGTAGCNLACRFCQNWSISKSREFDRLSDQASPEKIARVASELNCRSVAFTYNDPVIFAEYAMDVAQACHDRDVSTVAVTAGYITKQARGEFFQHIDAANVDLKAFSASFYKNTCSGDLSVVQETLRFLAHETDTWLEITTLLIPGKNDSDDELRRAADWVFGELGPDVPWHFTAFHPDYKMREPSRTPAATLLRARAIALEAGLHYVYVGNVHDPKHSSTYCSGCGACLIERDWFQLGQYSLNGNRCQFCGQTLAGRFGQGQENWGRTRQPVRLADFD